jgi:hypothetical protein
MQVVIRKIKDWLKPLVSFLIPGRYRRWWVGDPWNGQALRDICKYQVQTGLDTGSPLVEANFGFGMLINKQANKNPNIQIYHQKPWSNHNITHPKKNLKTSMIAELRLIPEKPSFDPKPYIKT